MALSDNLKRLIARQSLSVSRLAKQTGIAQPTLHHIVEGKTKRPREAVINKLAAFFQISPTALSQSATHRAERQLPVCHWSALQTLHATHAQLDQAIVLAANNAPSEDSVAINSESRANFAVYMDDASMEPVFMAGSILLFDCYQQAVDRDFVLVYLAHTQDFVFRRLLQDGQKQYLKATSPNLSDVPPTLLSGEDEIKGVLVESRLLFSQTRT